MLKYCHLSGTPDQTIIKPLEFHYAIARGGVDAFQSNKSGLTEQVIMSVIISIMSMG